jgi:hypothetical protein
MATILEFARTDIKFENLPHDLQRLPNWAFYTTKKKPIKLSAVARGWPEPGWNDGLEGDAAKAGARSNDENTWGLFDDCHRIWLQLRARQLPATDFIAGPSFALQEALGITVIDLDDPVEKVEAMKGVTAEQKEKMIASARYHQNIALHMFNGHYIERSVSGKGYHIFVYGRLPDMKYKFGFHGHVFGCCQFIHMTGNILR